MKIKSVYIENFKVLKNFKICFENDGKINPVTILTGINGTGKTTLLDFIYDFLTKQKAIKDNLNSYIEVDKEKMFHLDDILNLSSDQIKDFSSAPQKITGSILKDFPLNFSKNIIYYKANQDNIPAKKIITDYIDELIYEKNVKSSEVYDKMRHIIKETLSSLNMDIEFSKLDKNKEIYFKNQQSNNIKLNDLSGGEKELITKVFPLFISDYKDSIILIDEPESSLHPNWQNEVILLYRKIAERNNNQIIISTHSPHIVSGVENQYIKILVKDGENINVEDISTRSFGKRIDEILLDVFRVKGLRTPQVEKKLKNLRELLSKRKINAPEFNQLLEDLEHTIGKFDTDLTQIRLEKLKIQKENEENK